MLGVKILLGSLVFKTAGRILMKLGMHEVLKVPYQDCSFQFYPFRCRAKYVSEGTCTSLKENSCFLKRLAYSCNHVDSGDR